MVFTYIKAKNFKSLKEINLNLKKTQKATNKLVAIYGENGSGKTNVVELFEFLKKNVLSRVTDFCFTKLIEEEKENNEGFLEALKEFRKISLVLEDYRMLYEKDPTELEFGFELEGKEGYYYIKFNEKILEERLYYIVGKQRSNFFEIKKMEEKIEAIFNSHIFINEKYKEELYDNIEKYWGKFSFLSLLCKEKMDKNSDFINSRLNIILIKFINLILATSISVKNNKIQLFNSSIKNTNRISDLGKGRVTLEQKELLLKYERILKTFFIQAYADIKDVKYIIKEENDKLNYELYFSKMIGEKCRDIPISMESTGTTNLLKHIYDLIDALNGEVVIIDEIDNGIHDYLMKNILNSILPEITGQLIITTHNTLLLETLPKELIYILSVDKKGNKRIQSIKQMGINIQKNNNIRDLYLKGVFGGIPLSETIDFKEIKNNIKEETEEEDE